MTKHFSSGPFVRMLQLLIVGLIAVASGASAAEQRQHDAHEHGTGQLNIALDDNLLVVELEVPAANVVGFEHAPKSDKDHAAIDAALDSLREVTSWLRPVPPGSCSLHEYEIELIGERRTHDSPGDSEAHTRNEHKDDEEHKEHKEHGHDEGESEAHAELHAQYEFECLSPPEAIEITVGKVLRNMGELNSAVVTSKRQSAEKILSSPSVISLQ